MSAFDDAKYRYGRQISLIKDQVDTNFAVMIVGFIIVLFTLILVMIVLKDIQSSIHEIEHLLEIEHADHVSIEQLERAHYKAGG